MSEQKPSPVTYHEYDIPSLNSWFAWSAAALLLTSVWMIFADYDRDWKHYQARFNDLEIARTKGAIAAAEAGVSPKKLEQVQTALATAEANLAGQSSEVSRLETEIEALRGQWYSADQAYRFIKAELDVARFEVDDARQHQGDANRSDNLAAKQTAFDHVVTTVETRRLAFEDIDTKKSALELELRTLLKDRDSAERDLAKLTSEKSRLEKVLSKIDHGFIKDYFRDRPLVDFLAPSIKVSQVVLPNIHEDVNFMTVPRVDRCHSCHMAIDKPGWIGEDLPPEFRSHSRQALLLGNNHPVESLGCTGCHAGSGRAMTFSDTAHTPETAEQAKVWEDSHHWHELHYWDTPMLPLSLTEANCVNCHNQESRVPGADKLNAGRELVEKSGCFGCHKIDRPGYAELRKVGPDLSHITGKVTKDWMYKWIRHPKSFRPTTRMPRIWGNSNTAHATPTMNYPLRDEIEIEAVTRYLQGHTSQYPPLAAPIGAGDPKRGKWLVENRGCAACHRIGPEDSGAGRAGSDHGPDLSQIGSKLTLTWLYNWIRDPKAMWSDTKMPDLRLTDQEATDAAAYLLTLKNPEFEAQTIPDSTREEAQQVLADVTFEYLRKEMTTSAATTRRDEMSAEERFDYLGKKLIARQGCFGCHVGIPGFENAQPIGTELTEWASKLITKLDFGLVELPHTKYDWLSAKLTNPRVFDEGKVDSKDPQDLLRMPNFQFKPDEVQLLMTAILGFQRDLTQPSGRKNLSESEAAIETGRRLVEHYNCRGCHTIDSKGGGMETVLEGGLAFAPPVLGADYQMSDGRIGKTRQGAKTQPDWFFHFLKTPTTIRPWLNIRMPTFAMSDDHANKIVRYFTALAGAPYPYVTNNRDAMSTELVAEGKKLFDSFQCINCHLPMEEALKKGVKAEELAPNLELTKHRLSAQWTKQWLTDPSFIQEGTRMPAFFYLYDEDEKAYTELRPNSDHLIDALVAYLQFHGESMVRTASK